jgi:acyl-CoA thioesterase FadM
VYPWLRLIRIGFSALTQPKAGLLDSTSVRLRVWPNDLDFNAHVNNGRYLTLADMGRVHWFLRTGVLATARKHNAFPIVGDAMAKFRRDLRLFEKVEIRTRLLGWDHKWGFLEHRFVRMDRVLGVVAIRGVFKGAGGNLDPQEVLSDMAVATPSPALPEWTQRFNDGSELLSELLREEERA